MADRGETTIAVEGDIVAVRKIVRTVAQDLGFGLTDVTRIVTAASELARNIFHYAGTGTLRWQTLGPDRRQGLELVFADRGPGIPDVARAMQPGYTTGKGMGLGLPGAKRLLDELIVASVVGQATTVTARKWLKPAHDGHLT